MPGRISLSAKSEVAHRRLGELELLFHQTGKRFRAFTLSTVLRLEGSLCPLTAQTAVRRAISSDPYLTAKLSSGWQPELALSPAEPVVSIVPRTSGHLWKSTLEQEVNSPVEQTNGQQHVGQCRAVILHGTDQHEIVISVNHVVCDGEVLKSLIIRILRECLGSDAQQTNLPQSLQPPFDRTTSVRQWLGSTIGFFRQIALSFRQSGGFSKQEGQTAEDPGDRTFPGFLTLSVQDSRQLFDVCRANGLKVTCVLAAAVLFAMLECGFSSRSLLLQLNVDHRRQDARLMTLVGGVASFWELLLVRIGNGESMLSIARLLNDRLADAAQKNVVPPFGYGRLVSWFIRWKGGRDYCTSDVMLSNLGRLATMPSSEQLKLSELHVATSQNGCGSQCGVIATTYADRLSLTVMTRSNLSGNQREKLLRQIEANLLSFGGS